MKLFGKLTAILGLAVVGAASSAQADSDSVCVNVQVRGTTYASCSEVFENPNDLGWDGITIFAVHGFTRTGASWEGMADALFADEAFGAIVGRVVAIDLPGRGETPAIPGPYADGSFYGELVIQDNVGIVIDTLAGLPAQGYEPTAIMAHSMGGLETQAAQEALLASGSSLADLGVTSAVLLAPVPHAGATWTVTPSDPGALEPFVFGVPGAPPFDFGPVLALNEFAGLVSGGFTKLDGTLASTVPSAWFVTGIPSAWLGWEPLTLTFQLTTPARPSARDGAFAPSNGTQLTLVSFAQDVLTPTIDHPALAQQLIGKKPGKRLVVVGDPDAVHESYTVTPELVVEALRTAPNVF